MSRENEQFTPTPFEPASAQAQTPHKAQPATGEGSRWVIPALLGLLALAAGVIFLLPQPDPDPAEPVSLETASPTRPTPTSKPAEKPAGPEATPFSDAQQARLRKEAQDVLANLLELQASLQARGVEQWAPEPYAEAAAIAVAGDELYRQREYVAATERYTAGLTALQAIEASIPQRLAEQLELAAQAIEAGDAEAVAAALAQATLLGPDNEDLAALQARADALEAVMAGLATAREAEEAGDLAAAVKALEAATAADPAHQRAAGELARVSGLYTEQRFNRAMSEGYAALDEGRFNDARDSFRRARSLRDSAGEADSALRELQAAETAWRLASYQDRGRQQETAEDWQAAVESYEKALEIDGSVVFAQEGLARARPLAELQSELQSVIGKPERLADPTVAERAAGILARAREASAAGPVLEGQIAEVDALLAAANKPVTVTLQSDQQTSVVVYKVARLGQFSERELDLRPGTYTAVGTRNGYRDVRRNFTVSHEAAPEPVMIACTEPI